MLVFGPKELQTDVIEKGLCIGCGACVELCPYFGSHRGRTAMLFPCTLVQGSCYAYCPKVEVDLDELSQRFFGRPYDGSPLGNHLSVRVSRAGPRFEGQPAQAGGTVSSLMAFALLKDLIDAAVLTDREELLPVARLIKEPSGISRCATSKYAAAPTLSAFHRGAREGLNRMGLVATPCQTLAVAKMRSNPLNRADFQDRAALVVGLFCTWALDYRALWTFLAGRMDIAKIRKLDIPPPPAEVMEIYTDAGKQEIPLAEVRPHVPPSCAFCLDMTAEFADLSVGTLEGSPDLNTLIIRTERGRKIVEDAQKEGFLRVAEMPGENLRHLLWAAGNKKRRALEKLKGEGLVNTSKGRRAAVRISKGAQAAIRSRERKP